MNLLFKTKMKFCLSFLLTFILSACTPQESFNGADCDAGLFTKSLNDPRYKLVGDSLTIHSGAKSDYFNSPGDSAIVNSAPIMMFEIDNSQPFTFQARVNPAFSEVYDAGALYVYSNDHLWQKLAFEMDERGVSRVVTVRTNRTSDDNNHDSVSQNFVYLRLSSNTKVVGSYYSLDGIKWQLVRLYKNDYPKVIYLGLSSQSPKGEGINSHFSDIQFLTSSISDFRLGE